MTKVIDHLRKDIRHRHREIIISLVLLLIFAFDVQHRWNYRPLTSAALLRELVLPFLVVFSWCLLIARVVQEDGVVSETVTSAGTRACGWKERLIAKMCIVALCVNLPLLTCQLFLLWRAGFHAELSWVPRLLVLQFIVTLLFLLPVAAMAAVTRNFAYFVLAMLVFGVFFLAVGNISPNVGQANFGSLVTVAELAVIVAASLTMLVQSTRRNGKRAYAVLFVAALLIMCLQLLPQNLNVVSFYYPRIFSTRDLPVKIGWDSSTSKLPTPHKNDGIVGIEVPIVLAGISEDTILTVDGVMLTITSSDGVQWNSGWRAHDRLLMAGPQRLLKIPFSVKSSFLEKAKLNPVHLSISVALSIWQEDNQDVVTVKPEDFHVPGLGFCSTDQEYSLHCRFPLQSPQLMLLRPVSSQTKGLPLGGDEESTGFPAYGWSCRQHAGPLNSIGVLHLVSEERDGEQSEGFRVCPGSQLLVSMLREKKRLQAKIDLGNHTLAE